MRHELAKMNAIPFMGERFFCSILAQLTSN